MENRKKGRRMSTLGLRFHDAIQTPLVRNILKIAGGNVLAQVVLLGTAPILTRLYSPEDFGVLALFTTTCAMLNCFSSLCYERAILLPKEDRDALSIVILGGVILIVTTLMVTCLTFLLKPAINSSFPALQTNAHLIQILPLGMVLLGIWQILQYWNLRRKQFHRLTASKVSETGVSSLFKIFSGLSFGGGFGWLIGGYLLGYAASILIQAWGELFSLGKAIRTASFRAMKEQALRYKSFPLFATWNYLLNQIMRSSVVYCLSYFYAPSIVGFFSVGSRLLQQPILFLSDAVQKVYFQKSAEDFAHGLDINREFRRILILLSLIGGAPFLVLLFFGAPIFSVVFGGQWETAGVYAQIMAPWFFFIFVGAPSNVIYEVLQRQKIKLLLNGAKSFLAVAGLITFSVLSKDPIEALAIYTVVNCLFEVATIALAAFLVAKQTQANETIHV